MSELITTHPISTTKTKDSARSFRNPFSGLISVMVKEFIHIRRDPATFFFVIVIPAIQMLIMGFGVNANVRNIPTVVYDASSTQESRHLIDRFVNSDDFRIVNYVTSDAEMNRAIVAGKAQVAIKIPPDYARILLSG